MYMSCSPVGACLAGCAFLAIAWASGCAGPTSGGAGGLGSGGTGTGGAGAGGTKAVVETGGQVGAGGMLAAGGSGSGGLANPGGSGGGGGSVASGGSTGHGGGAGSGVGSGGSSRGGSAGSTAGSGGSAAGGSAGGSTGACGPTSPKMYPFGCKFAWGVASPNGSLAGLSYVQFVSTWIESNISTTGTMTNCSGCTWLKNSVASTNLIPAYYAYIIGFLAHANGIVDGNQSGSKKLSTDGAALVKANYNAIIAAYAWYAQKTAAAWPTKPLIWLLEGDFVQFTDAGQSSPMTYAEIGKLAADITCAIKSNMPNAVVAIDHSAWNADQVTNSYWGAMANVNYDMVWTTGVGNNKGFINGDATSTTYNAKTATYAYLYKLTGRTILVDTSAGASAAGDSWSTASLADLNARISEGVIAANITGTVSGGLQSNINNLSGLSALPSCQ
jgi:hypothetical protein